MSKETLSLLEQLAQKLGIAVESLLDIYTAQAKVSIFTNAISLAFCVLAILVLCWFVYFTTIKKSKDGTTLYMRLDDGCEFGPLVAWIIAIIVLSILAIVGFFVVISSLQNIIICVFNPEYWAINKILSYVTGT